MGTAQMKAKCNQDRVSEDKQTGNQNHNVLYASNAGNLQTDETESPSAYIDPRNIGNLAMHNMNHLHKQTLGATQQPPWPYFLQVDILGFVPAIPYCIHSTPSVVFLIDGDEQTHWR